MATEHYYFTFGCGFNYGKRKGKAVRVPGDWDLARERFERFYGGAYCTQYDEEYFRKIQAQYGIELYDEGIIFDCDD